MSDQNDKGKPKWYRIQQSNETQSLANLLCVRRETRGWAKRKIIRRSGSAWVHEGFARWPERLLNITSNYITPQLEAQTQRSNLEAVHEHIRRP